MATGSRATPRKAFGVTNTVADPRSMASPVCNFVIDYYRNLGLEKTTKLAARKARELGSEKTAIQDEFNVQTANIQISFHGDDEFWYMNPSDSYVETNHLTTGTAHGAYHEVLVTSEGKLVGVVISFAVIFTGRINPLFWEPVCSPLFVSQFLSHAIYLERY
ncbi:hypothetical protein L1887_27583 [Cichorium endivia]|nr:hypothetical protein L1887_27583 [Cichorium endivia]